MPLKDKPKSPHKILQNIDSEKVDQLLEQINTGSPDIKSNANIKWHVTCQSAMVVARELFHAWECNALSAADIKKYLNGMRNFSLCLPVCATAWLCTHMGITHQDALLKPMNMVQQFLTPVPADETQDPKDHYKERFV